MKIYKAFRNFIVFILFFSCFLGMNLAAQDLKALLLENECNQALPLMQKMAENQSNGKLFYNLALCHAKEGNYSQSILYAKKADKWNFNKKKTSEIIDLAENKLELQWNKPPEFFIFKWIKSLRDLMTAKLWAWFSIFCLLVSSISYYWYRHREKFSIIARAKF